MNSDTIQTKLTKPNINDNAATIVNYVFSQLGAIWDQFKDFQELWKVVDPFYKDDQEKIHWKNYRINHVFSVCSQEIERIRNAIQLMPTEELFSKHSLQCLERQYGLWQEYDSDSDDEDWDETRYGSLNGNLTSSQEELSESEEDIEIIE